MYLYQKGDFESMRKDAFGFSKEKYFNGHSDTRSVQENLDLITSFIQDLADKHIPSKTSRSVSSVPWLTPEIRRKIGRKIKLMQKQKRQAVANLDQNMFGNNMICMLITWFVMLRQTPETSISTSVVRKKTPKVFHP